MRVTIRFARLPILLAATAGLGLGLAAASPPAAPGDALPGAVPTGTVPTGTVPTGAVPTGTVAAAGPGPAAQAAPESSDVPDLPFDDNPDPDQCGIPLPLGDGVRGTVTGRWQGELLFEDVHLYDGHLRAEVTGTVPDGSEVRVAMFQNNPVLNYWFVRWDGPDGTVEGWLPEPFLLRD